LDTHNYISSGILENYVLGLLSENENGAVERVIQQNKEVASYVNSLEQTLAAYGQLHAVQPPAELKSKVLDQIRTLQSDADNQKPYNTPVEKQLNNNARPKPIKIWRALAIAGIVVLLVSLSFNIYLSTRQFKTQQQAQDIARQNKVLLNKNEAVQQKLTQAEKQVALMYRSDLQAVVMKGVPQHATFNATVFWNADNRTVYLGNSDLPVVPTGKVYQLWAIVDGKPVSLGLFSPEKNSLPVQMTTIQSGKVQAFAITLEQSGGSPTPTMDQMYVMGATS